MEPIDYNEDYPNDSYLDAPAPKMPVAVTPQKGLNLSSLVLTVGLLFTIFALALRGCVPSDAQLVSVAEATTQESNNESSETTHTEIFIPDNQDRVACVLNGGGLACANQNYLPCSEIVDGRCTRRETLIPNPKITHEEITVDFRGRPRCRRYFNGRCWTSTGF